MRKLRRILAILFVVAILLTLFAACSKTGTCESCGKKNQKLKKYEYDGKTAWVCSECYDTLKALEAIGNAFK